MRLLKPLEIGTMAYVTRREENGNTDAEPDPFHAVAETLITLGHIWMGCKCLLVLVAIESTNNGEMGEKLPSPSTVAGCQPCAHGGVTDPDPESHR